MTYIYKLNNYLKVLESYKVKNLFKYGLVLKREFDVVINKEILNFKNLDKFEFYWFYSNPQPFSFRIELIGKIKNIYFYLDYIWMDDMGPIIEKTIISNSLNSLKLDKNTYDNIIKYNGKPIITSEGFNILKIPNINEIKNIIFLPYDSEDIIIYKKSKFNKIIKRRRINLISRNKGKKCPRCDKLCKEPKGSRPKLSIESFGYDLINKRFIIKNLTYKNYYKDKNENIIMYDTPYSYFLITQTCC